MRVVVDTNVLISAAFTDRTPEDVIMFRVSHPGFQWIATEKILEEYLEVLDREKFGLTGPILQIEAFSSTARLNGPEGNHTGKDVRPA